MRWLQELIRRIDFLRHRNQADADLAEEMRLHMQLRAEEQAANGISKQDASYAARRQFGNVTQLQESGREAWGWAWLDSILQDTRYALRTLKTNPGFTATAILSLALGIGANTAIFSILNAVMLRSLPVEDPSRLVELQQTGPYFTNPIWEQVRDHQQAFTGVLAYSGNRFNLSDSGEVHYADGVFVSGDYFRVLGVPAVRGRVFTPADDRRGGGKYGPSAVISYSFWKAHFASDPDIIGKKIRLDRHPFEIVGVTAPWFKGLDVDRGFDVAIPIGCEPIMHTDMSALDQRSWWWLRILGRLAPGEAPEQAQAKLNSIAPEINRATLPEKWLASDQKNYLKRTFTLDSAKTGFSDVGDRYKKALFTLMAVVGLVLLIACANIANLLLARATARQREISIRLAIGAARRRVVRQLLTESLLLSLAGAIGGLLFAKWGSQLLVTLLSSTRNPLDIDVSPDATVLLFTTAIAVFTGVLFGLAPALRGTSVAPNQSLKEHALNFTRGGSRLRLGRTLVAGQVALSLILLVGAGLFLGTIRNLLNQKLGFNPHDVLLVHVNTLDKVPKKQRTEVYQRLESRLRNVPGVSAVTASMITPTSHFVWNDNTFPEGYTEKSTDDTLTYFNRVSPGYFRTLQTKLIAGRDFNDHDTLAAPPVIIINEKAARQFFGGANPIGKTIAIRNHESPDKRDVYQICGVVQDSKYADLREDQLDLGFLPLAQDPDPFPETTYSVRTAASLDSLIPAIRNAISDASPGLTVEFNGFENQVKESVLQERLIAMLAAFFGGLGLLLAMIGLYGVTSYAVARRRSEIGIRMALGASQSAVIWLVLRDVILMLAIGTVAGLGVSVAAGRLVQSLLYGVKSTDPQTMLVAAAVLATATAIAAYLPAFRASRLDPTVTLRDE